MNFFPLIVKASGYVFCKMSTRDRRFALQYPMKGAVLIIQDWQTLVIVEAG